tara:strand:- start:219 stop:815 length:597 start_codon:yes stop_codon:yes gene_type:complete
MADSLGDTIKKAGSLNATSFDQYDLKLDVYSQDKASIVIKEAIDKVYGMSLEDKEGGPYNAICLASTENPSGNIPLVKNYEGPVTQVIARIPKLHAAIPVPFATGPSGLGCAANARAAIMMHPVFYAETNTNTPLPQPGNIVKVNLSSGQSKHGEYLGIVDSKTTGTLCEEEPASSVVENPNAVPQTLEDNQEGQNNG